MKIPNNIKDGKQLELWFSTLSHNYECITQSYHKSWPLSNMWVVTLREWGSKKSYVGEGKSQSEAIRACVVKVKNLEGD